MAMAQSLVTGGTLGALIVMKSSVRALLGGEPRAPRRARSQPTPLAAVATTVSLDEMFWG